MSEPRSSLVGLARKVQADDARSGDARIESLIQGIDNIIDDLDDRRDVVVALIYSALGGDLLSRLKKSRRITDQHRMMLIDEFIESFVDAPDFFESEEARRHWIRHIHRYAAAYRDTLPPSRRGEIQHTYTTQDGVAFLLPNGQQAINGGDPVVKVTPSLPLTMTVLDPSDSEVTRWLSNRVAEEGSSSSGAATLYVLDTSAADGTPPGVAALALAPYVGGKVTDELMTRSGSKPELADDRVLRSDLEPGTSVVLIGGASRKGRRIGNVARKLEHEYEVHVSSVLTLVDFQEGAAETLERQGIHLTSYRTIDQVATPLREAYFQSLMTVSSTTRDSGLWPVVRTARSLPISAASRPPIVESVTDIEYNEAVNRNIESSLLPLPEFDSWSQAWADPTLRNLGRWISSQNVGSIAAEQTLARLYSYYSFEVIPAYGGYPSMAVSVKQADDETLVYLQLPKAVSRGQRVGNLARELDRGLERYERSPLLGAIRLQLEVADVAESDLGEYASSVANGERRQFLGVYHDDLPAELSRLVPEEHLQVWLETSSEQLGNRSPIELLNDPNADHLLRDLVVQAKYGLAA